MTIAEQRAGLATALATISGVRASGYQLDQINPPQAEVRLDRVEYDLTFGRGADVYFYTVTLSVQRTSELAAQKQVDSYCDGFGATSVKAVIEADATLGGVCDYARVRQVSGVAETTVGDISYLMVSFDVEVVV